MFLKTSKFGMQQKAHIFVSELPNLNSFHILTRDTESNHLKQKKKKKKEKKKAKKKKKKKKAKKKKQKKKKKKKKWTKTLIWTKNNDF